MKKNLHIIITSLFAFSLLTACSGNEPATSRDENRATGYLKLNGAGIDAAVEAHPFGRSVDDITIEIVDSEGAQVGSYPYSQIAGKTIALPVGIYTLEAFAGNPETNAFDAPYYEGKITGVEIANNMVVEPDPIVCRMANVMVSVRMSPRLRTQIGAGAVVNVVNPATQAGLQFTLADIDAEAAGYFSFTGEGMELEAIFEGKLGNTSLTSTIVCENVEKGQHRILTYALKDDSGYEEGYEPPVPEEPEPETPPVIIPDEPLIDLPTVDYPEEPGDNDEDNEEDPGNEDEDNKTESKMLNVVKHTIVLDVKGGLK